MTRRTPRTAFTLIELLVAIALAIVVLGLTIYIVNSAMFDSYKVVGSGDRLSQWLMIAKNRALRDKAPRGLRLYVKDVNGVKVVQEAAYIERPDALNLADQFPNARMILYYPASGSPPTIDSSQRRVYIAGPTFAELNGQIRSGDTVYFPDLKFAFTVGTGGTQGLHNETSTAGNNPGGASVRIDVDGTTLPDLGAAHTITPPGGANPSPPNNGTVAFSFANGGVVIFRQPVELLGEPTLQITSGMAVDTTLSEVDGSKLDTLPNTTDYYDILFAPTGEVIGTPSVRTPHGFIGLLLRDMNKKPGSLTLPGEFDQAGEMVIVAIYPRTGAVATHPVANDTDPFRFAKDAINSGL